MKYAVFNDQTLLVQCWLCYLASRQSLHIVHAGSCLHQTDWLRQQAHHPRQQLAVHLDPFPLELCLLRHCQNQIATAVQAISHLTHGLQLGLPCDLAD